MYLIKWIKFVWVERFFPLESVNYNVSEFQGIFIQQLNNDLPNLDKTEEKSSEYLDEWNVWNMRMFETSATIYILILRMTEIRKPECSKELFQ